jgi:hypothetical protein
MTEDVLLTMLCAGIVRGIGLGATANDVRQRLGEPDSDITAEQLRWSYGELAVTFHSGRVALLAITSASDGSLARRSVERMLADRALASELDPLASNEHGTTLRVPALRATLSFEPVSPERLRRVTVASLRRPIGD